MSALLTEFGDQAPHHKPVVMAFIGDDDPRRGDSRGAVGVAKAAASMLQAEYVYLDAAMLKREFPFTFYFNSKSSIGYEQAVRRYLKRKGVPDIVIGTNANDIRLPGVQPPLLIESRYNEEYSKVRSSLGAYGLSCHDLDRDALNVAAAEFREHYPNIKTPLIGVHVTLDAALGTVSDQLAKMVSHYPAATVFICEGRNVGMSGDYKSLLPDCIRQRCGSAVDVIEVSYEQSQAGYNPYPGLIGAADQHVVLGTSQSVLSEVLVAGKMVVTDYGHSPYIAKSGLTRMFKDMGYGALPDISVDVPDVTRAVARDIVSEYKRLLMRSPA